MKYTNGINFLITVMGMILTAYIVDISISSKHSIIEIWLLVAGIISPVIFYKIIIDNNGQKSNIFCNYYPYFILGTYSMLALKSVLIVDIWYNDQNNGVWEPLFIMLSIATAAIIFGDKLLKKTCEHKHFTKFK